MKVEFMPAPSDAMTGEPHRHCEERRDEAIQPWRANLDCFAEFTIGPATSGRTRWLAMTTTKIVLAMR
jgi:hypothetical protein